MTLEELAVDILDEAIRLGATASDVVIARGDAFSASVRLGEVEKIHTAQEKRLGLRLFVGQRSAIASTSRFARTALRDFIDETLGLAKVTAGDDAAGLPDQSDLAQDVADLDLVDRAAKLDPEEKLALAREAEEATFAADSRITNSEGSEFSDGFREVVYANSLGFCGSYQATSFSLSVVPVAAQAGTMQRDYWYSSQRKRQDLEPAAEIGQAAAQRAVRRLGARQPKTQEAPVIFEPEMAATLLRHLAAAVSGSALYRKMSFLIDRIGDQIAAEAVSIEDDARIPSALGSKPFDGEGLATRRNIVVENGILTGYLLDSYSARKLGAKPTGNASRSLADAPSAGPTNFFLRPGTTPPDEIIRSVRSGLYVTELSGFGVNPVTGDYSRGAVGQWIENGELAYPVEEITIAGNLLEMLKNVEVVGNDLERRGTISAPTLKIARMTIAGA